MANELRGVAGSGTLYARIASSAGLWWNTNSAAFEAYSAGNYGYYDVALTEQGNSGVYVADFPSGITASGTYEYYVHRQLGASPAEGDPVVNTGKIDWSGTVSVTSGSGSMTAADFYAYLLRLGFKRTDKSTEAYEAITDAVQDMRRRFAFDEAAAETTITDTISTSGDFKMAVESNFGLLLGVVMQDGVNAHVLKHRSKKQFDDLYPDINVTADQGYPEHFCIYGGYIYIGPIPDATTYIYRKSYSERAGTITASSSSVPFTTVYRDILADNVLSKLYKGLEEYEKAEYHRTQFEQALVPAIRKERKNARKGCFVGRIVDC